MKKRIFSRVLALFMALSLLTTTVFAASFDDLQNAINGEGGTPIGEENRYGWSQNENGWGIEAWGTEDGRNVQLNENVTYTESDTNSTITIDKDQNVNLDLNDNNITGDGEHNVIDVTGNLTITGADSKTPEDGTHNTIKGGEIGINVEQGGELALGGVTVTGNEIGVSFFDDLSVTFIGDQNVVSGNKTKQISGDGKVKFELDGKEYKVDASTADALLENSGKVVAAGNNWVLAESNDGTYTVAYTGTEEKLVNPKSILNDAAKASSVDKAQITGFVIPKEVTFIGQSAFQQIETLRHITFAKGSKLAQIDRYAFLGTGLEGTIQFPASLTAIGEMAFKDCKSLRGISFPENSELTSISSRAFASCTGLTQIILPESLTDIGGNAFSSCTGLEQIVIPGNVSTIGGQAFAWCSSLAKVSLPDSLVTIGSGAFLKTGLTSITIPANVTTIEGTAFKQCAQLREVIFAENSKLTTIGYDVFLFSGLSGKVVIPDTVTSIGQSAFAGCPDLKEIVLPKSLKEIPNVFIAQNSSTTFLEIPSTVESVHKTAFITYDNSIKSVVVALEDGKMIDNVGKLVGDLRAATTKETSQNNGRYCDCNLYITSGAENVTFYRGTVSADFDHNSVDTEISRTDGSVNLTNVSGTITTGDATVTLPNVAGITASIDTDGKITLYVPGAITVNGREYPDGADVTVEPNGNITADPHEAPPDNPPVISFDFDTMDTGTGTTIEDEEVPLAGLVTLAELLEALREYEGIEDVELPEDFQWIDHDYAQAIHWGLNEALVVDTEDDPLDPDEIVTVALLREVLENFVEYKGANLTVTVEGEDDMIVMDLGERLTVFYGELEAALEGKAA